MRVSTYVLLSASAFGGAAAYAVTRLLAKTALDKERYEKAVKEFWADFD